ncbi:BMP/retinoic acid-inducible neural-specific protein 3 [Geospiza fortis]|uniref:BMP/retinoic acid-inducible neural-specific protein 3 n=1 Tax=Geospiza fortis TaxID=48883 RepID=A0A8N5F1X5_GEOFO|nr:BMP/retinoic acid-inducible neural-specific protein 3 [Geospiza fortis]
MIWRCSAGAELFSLMALWEWIALSLHCWVLAVAAVSDQHATSPFDWLLSDKGPFHRSQEYTDFVDRSRQGFSTRYKIYREFGRWKVNNLAVERRNFLGSPLPLAPEFFRNIRLLGRRPTLQQITENLIKKYGTHFLLSATLGGEESLTIFVDKRKLSKRSEGSDPSANSSVVTLETLHQLAASYFIDRDSTLRRLHHIQIASTAIKVTETRTGPLGCSNYDNLDSVSSVLVQSPENKIQLQGLQVILPEYLQEHFVQAALSYIACNSEGEFICKDNDCWCQCGPKFPECNCPYMDIQAMEENLLRISETWNAYNSEFEESDEFKLFMKRLPMNYFLNTSAVMHLWTMDSNFQRRYEQLESSMKQLFLKAQRTVHKLFSLSKRCHKQPLIRMPRQRCTLRTFLQKTDRRIEVHAIFISNDMRLNSWFDPSWRKRMLLTLKSNKYKSSLVHMILGLSLQICLTKNSTLEPVLAVYINPFGGSHSESWFMPVNENNFPDWERTKLDLPLQCYNWTLTLGNKWKTFFETVHIYLRSRIKSNGPNGNESIYYEPLEFIDPSRNLGYMKINNIQVFGYSMHFDPEAIRDLILQLDYPYTQGSQDSALLQLLEIRDRVNKLSPPGQRRLDLFSCLLRHRLKLSTSEVVRIQSALQAFNAKLPNTVDYDTTKLCS